jgi:hypothetical protein
MELARALVVCADEPRNDVYPYGAKERWNERNQKCHQDQIHGRDAALLFGWM